MTVSLAADLFGSIDAGMPLSYTNTISGHHE